MVIELGNPLRPCMSCGHRQANHPFQRELSFPVCQRRYCTGFPDHMDCGCGITQEEIDEAYDKAERK